MGTVKHVLFFGVATWASVVVLRMILGAVGAPASVTP